MSMYYDSRFPDVKHVPRHLQKLTPVQRQEVRRRYQDGETATSLALEFHVSAQTIRLMAGRR